MDDEEAEAASRRDHFEKLGNKIKEMHRLKLQEKARLKKKKKGKNRVVFCFMLEKPEHPYRKW